MTDDYISHNFPYMSSNIYSLIRSHVSWCSQRGI